jgi:hypothetical protein
MADCQDLFSTFHEAIAVSTARKSELRASRNATRERIERHFRETLKVSVPKFHGQGSYSMNTLVNPIAGRYDIDDGVYLTHLSVDRRSWPTSATVHGWLVEATKASTSELPQVRARCVRVIYSATPPYHIDLPVYVEENGLPQLFDADREKKTDPPVSPYTSDPMAMTAWFDARVDAGDQLRRLVRYAKAWKDFKRNHLPSAVKGLMLTILVAETFSTSHRDDLALASSIDRANSRMKASLVVKKPVAPFENLADGWAGKWRTDFLEQLQQFRDLSADATAEKDRAKAAKIWQKLLGERFPDAEPDPDKAKGKALKTSAPAIIGRDGRSA